MSLPGYEPHPQDVDIDVRPSETGCLCGMLEWYVARDGSERARVEGGDCRSIGCDPYCPVCNPDGPEL